MYKHAERQPFKVVKRLTIKEALNYTRSNLETLHLEERDSRKDIYEELSEDHIYAAFLVDKQHVNGLEVHVMYSSGKIKFYNEKSKKLISLIAARPGQIRRYFHKHLWNSPEIKKLTKTAYDNSQKNLNNV